MAQRLQKITAESLKGTRATGIPPTRSRLPDWPEARARQLVWSARRDIKEECGPESRSRSSGKFHTVPARLPTDERHFLQGLEIDERLQVVENRQELIVPRHREVALGLEDEEARRRRDVEPALLRLQPPFGELARDAGRFDLLQPGRHAPNDIAHLAGDAGLDLRGRASVCERSSPARAGLPSAVLWPRG